MGDEKNEGQILSPEMEISGFKVKPWSFDQFFAMLPIFASAASILKAKGISFSKLEKMAEDPEKLLNLICEAGPVAREMVAKTIGMSPDEVGKLEFDRVISVALVILVQNAERIKNFSGLGKIAMSSLTVS